MTVTPTLEQIEAERINAMTFVMVHGGDNVDEYALAIAFATARLEGEAKGQERGLDDAAAVARAHDLSLMSMTPSDVTARMIAAGIIALKKGGAA